jgi:hypothetical protein
MVANRLRAIRQDYFFSGCSKELLRRQGYAAQRWAVFLLGPRMGVTDLSFLRGEHADAIWLSGESKGYGCKTPPVGLIPVGMTVKFASTVVRFYCRTA